MFHSRKIYGFLDLLGNFGGIKEALILIAAFIMGPITEHSFNTKAISKLYVAKTREQNLFEQKPPKQLQKFQ